MSSTQLDKYSNCYIISDVTEAIPNTSFGIGRHPPLSVRAEYSNSHNRYHPVTGWPAPILASLDEVAPGFLVAMSRSKAVYRQAIFAGLAAGIVDRPTEFLERATGGEMTETSWHGMAANLALTLLNMTPQELLAASHRTVGDGLLGALERIGYQPLTAPNAYPRLNALLTGRGNGRRVRALQQGGRIQDRLLDVVERLEPALLHPNVVRRIRTVTHADQINETLRLVQQVNSSATPEAIWKSSSDLGDGTDLTDWLRRFLLKGDCFPAPPFEMNDAELVPLRSGQELEDAGHRYSNCLSTKVLQVLSGRTYFYEFTVLPGAVVSFHRLSCGTWLMTKAYGRRNGTVSREITDQIRAKVQALGGKCLTLIPVQPRYMIADRFFDGHDFGFWSDIAEDMDILALDDVA